MNETGQTHIAEANVFCSRLHGGFDGSLFFLPAQTLCHTLLPLSQMDHDPRNPTYISSQGPLPSTVADFWQVILISIHCGLLPFCFYRDEGLEGPQQSCTLSEPMVLCDLPIPV